MIISSFPFGIDSRLMMILLSGYMDLAELRSYFTPEEYEQLFPKWTAPYRNINEVGLGFKFLILRYCMFLGSPSFSVTNLSFSSFQGIFTGAESDNDENLQEKRRGTLTLQLVHRVCIETVCIRESPLC